LGDDESIEGNRRITNTRIHEVFIILYIYKRGDAIWGVVMEILGFEYDLDLELGIN